MRDIDWQQKLMDFVQERQSMPFQWGVNDCTTFSADAIVEMGGPDLMADVRGKYSTAAGSKRVLSKHFPDGPKEYVDGKLEPIGINFAQRGDLVLFDGPEGETFGIYWIGGIFSVGPEGSVFLDEAHDKILRVWRV